MAISPISRSPTEDTEYTHNISLADDLINILTTTSTSRYQSVSFQGSLSSTSNPQYSQSLTVAEMVSVWYNPQSRGELVGNLCSTHLQCDNVCFGEVVTSPEREYSDDSYMFNSLILGGFLLFVLILLTTSISTSLDAIYWTGYISMQIQPMDDLTHSVSLLQLSYTLSKVIIAERERFFAEEMGPTTSDQGLIFKTHDDRCDVEAIREALYEKYGKKTFIKHMTVSESSENNK